MNRAEVGMLLMCIAAAYPYYAKQQTEGGRQNQEATASVWEMALAAVEYADASKALAQHIKQNKFAPSPAEVIELAQQQQPNTLDTMAAEDAEYRSMFPGWVNDRLPHWQRVQRLKTAKLAAAESKRITG